MENAIAIINEDDGKEDVKQFVDLPYDILIDIIYRLPFNEMINLSQSCHKMCSTVLQYIRHKTKSFCIIDFVEKNRLTSIKGFALFIKRCTSPLPEWERIKFLFDLIKNSREWKYIRQQSLHSAICIEQQFDSYETVKLVYNTMILGWPKEHQMEAVNDLAEYMDIGLLTKAFFMKPIGISKEDEVQLTMRVQLITRSMIVDPHCSLMNELIIINEIMFANHPDSIIQILMLFYGPRIICNYVRVRLVQITVEWRSYCTYKLSIAYEQLSKVFLTLYQHCEELNWTKTFVLKLMFELFHFPAPWYATHIADFMSNIGKQLSIDFIRYVIKHKHPETSHWIRSILSYLIVRDPDLSVYIIYNCFELGRHYSLEQLSAPKCVYEIDSNPYTKRHIDDMYAKVRKSLKHLHLSEKKTNYFN